MMMPFESKRSCLLLLFTALLASASPVVGCSCASPGDTPAEQAAYIRDSDWINFYAIAQFVDEASYSKVDEPDDDLYEPYEFTFQNTTFTIEDVVYNPSGEIPSAIDIQPDGTMKYQTSTETTCCICGRSFSAESIGQTYLIPVSSYGGLSICEIVCNVEDEFCNGIISELRNNESIDNGGGLWEMVSGVWNGAKNTWRRE